MQPATTSAPPKASMGVSVLPAYLAASGGRFDMAAAVLLLATILGLAFERLRKPPLASYRVRVAASFLGPLLFLIVAGLACANPRELADLAPLFIAWLACLLLLSPPKTGSDLWTLALLSTMLFLIGAVHERPAGFLLLLVASAGGALWTFHASAARRQGREGRVLPAAVAIQLALALGSASILFIVFPRTAIRERLAALPAPIPLEPGTTAPSPIRSGLPAPGEFLRIRDLAPLKRDPQPALTLELPADAPEPTPYLRSGVHERYEDGGWLAARAWSELESDADGWIVLQPPWLERRKIRQIVQLEAPAELAVGLLEPIRIKIPRLRTDGRGTLAFTGKLPAGFRYEVESIAASAIDDPSLKPLTRPALLDLPPRLQEIRRIARDVTAGLDRPLERIEALRKWLVRDGGFSYQLAPPPAPAGQDPIEHFLSAEGRRGYCVHFATALALLCRATGIPARVATGFHLGSFDRQTGRTSVRMSDAHAWVEVPFPRHGWVIFDATPEESTAPLPAVATDAGRPGRAGEAPDGESGDSRWDRFVLDFDKGNQRELFRKAGSALVGVFSVIGRAARSPAVILVLIAVLACAALGFRLLPRRIRTRLRQRMGGFRDRSSVPFYQDFLWIAWRRGIRRPRSATAGEFAAIASRSLPAEAVDLVTRRFDEVRFGGRMLTRNEESALEQALAVLETGPAIPPGSEETASR